MIRILITAICLLLVSVVCLADNVFFGSNDLSKLPNDIQISNLVFPIWYNGQPISEENLVSLKNWKTTHPETRLWGFVQLYRVEKPAGSNNWLEQTINSSHKPTDEAFFNVNDPAFTNWQLERLADLIRRLPELYGIDISSRLSWNEIFGYSDITRLTCLEEIGIDPVDVLPDPEDPSEQAITKKWLSWRERQNANFTAKVITLAHGLDKHVSVHGYHPPNSLLTATDWTLLAKQTDQIIFEKIGDCSDEQIQQASNQAKKLNPNIRVTILVFPKDQVPSIGSVDVYHYR